MTTSPQIDGLGLTARWVAALRERETLRHDRLFDDPLAGALAGEPGRAFASQVEADLPGLAGNRGLAVRTRYLDEMLAAATASGVRQVVMLAAGLDARAYRLDWPAGTVVYEVERAPVLALKAEILGGLRVVPRAERRVVEADLRDDFVAALEAAGFQRASPTAFLVEGLMVYLPDRAAVLRILREVARIAAPGSWVGLDLVGTRFLQLPVLAPVHRRLAALGAPWSFGTDDPQTLMAEAGFASVEVLPTGSAPYRPASPQAGKPMSGDAYFMVTARV